MAAFAGAAAGQGKPQSVAVHAEPPGDGDATDNTGSASLMTVVAFDIVVAAVDGTVVVVLET